MLNMSNIVFRIRAALGIMNLALPFEDVNNMIVRIIQEITIPIFSTYVPDRRIDRVDVGKEFQKIDDQATYVEYLLPDFKNEKLLYINDVYYNDDTLTNLGYYAGTIPMGMEESSFIEQMILNNLSKDIVNSSVPKMTFQFTPPRRLRLYNAYCSNIMTIDWSFEHSKSLNTIPDDAINSFLKLAILDVKCNIYPSIASYLRQNTQYGTIELPLDSWGNAESDRDALLSDWDDRYHLDMVPFYYG